MTEATIRIADLQRVYQIVPDMPFSAVIEMAIFIAEISPAVEYTLASATPVVVGIDWGRDDFRPDPAEVEALADHDPEDHPVFLQPDLYIVAPADDAPARPADPEPQPEPDAAPEPEAVLQPEPAVQPEPEPAPTPAPPPAVPDRTGEPWTDAEKATVQGLRNKGLTAREIGLRMGRTHQTVSWMLAKLTREAAIKPKPQPTPAPAAEAPKPGLTGNQRALMERIMKLDDVFTPTDDLYLVDQIIARASLDLIADQLGCDAPTVKARWAALVGMDPATLRQGVPLQVQTDLLFVLRQMAGVAA